MKRILSAIGLVPLAIALVLTLGMTTAGAATAMTPSSTSSIVKDAQSYHPENFKCHYEKSEGSYYYHCYSKYKDHGRWYDYDWWLKGKDAYNPPGSDPDYPDYFWCHYQKHHGDKEYYCYYKYYNNHHSSKTYYWWWNYDPPNPH